MHRLPEKGIAWEALERQMQAAKAQDVDWVHGRAAVYIHYAGEDVLEVAKKAYLMFFSENGLGLRAFHSLATFEREVVGMGLSLLNGGNDGRGAMTTGGTESIFLAVKAARDWAHRTRPVAGTPEILLARTAHPAFDKAAHFLGLGTVRVPVGPDFTADVAAMRRAVTPRTVMVVGSAPAYPHGVVDPITDLAALAAEANLWMHVDACVGGYIAPFARKLGAPIADFDFAVPGVTSISADLHKYGYTAKGASTLFFRDVDAFGFMAYDFDNWPRGRYLTNTLVGTRAGGAIAAAWAVMNYLGEAGYLRVTERILATRRAYEDGLVRLGLKVWGRPELGILAYGSERHDIQAIGERLASKGWLVGYLTEPMGIHLMLNLTHEPVVDAYLADVAWAMETAGTVAGTARTATY
ncbi:pyridoxal phosphate-dependent decarboxylase family protein [Vineibacter terrae]|uniref:pyridoxal phosphate-dependent decarboxylase family protein n=1 Tax=Vineibacter terrae TaxID=2586908 RepID=UPI002E2EF4E1|nr:aminotransferase class V-fold PLP-dependent enzyme [Vineibacter terrae]HEX2892257.1 aminotransferase class V-fold PLP-dependent enzyme [Vineibacter terrae]